MKQVAADEVDHGRAAASQNEADNPFLVHRLDDLPRRDLRALRFWKCHDLRILANRRRQQSAFCINW